MKEHPIIFSTEMVKAILEGRKTMTRRVVKDPRRKMPENPIAAFGNGHGRLYSIGDMQYEASHPEKPNFPCPYGQVGDHLWVRETFAPREMMSGKAEIAYKADGGQLPSYLLGDKEIPCYWKPSIHMPRWASRITLEITNIRVERLQEITNDDAFKEGMTRELASKLGISVSPSEEEFNLTQTRRVFIDLWDSINAKRGYSWESNPWVWVIEFKVLPNEH